MTDTKHNNPLHYVMMNVSSVKPYFVSAMTSLVCPNVYGSILYLQLMNMPNKVAFVLGKPCLLFVNLPK
jgi:hypothetical protein